MLNLPSPPTASRTAGPRPQPARATAPYPSGRPASWSRKERDRLYDEFQPLVQRLVFRFGSTPDLRQDLAGEIYCRFCALLDAYDPARGVPLRPYLARMLQLTTFNYVREQWRHAQRHTSLQAEEEAGLAVPAAEGGAEWFQRLAGEAVVEALPAAIARLPTRQRLVVVWRFYENRSFDEIAEQLEIQPSTARSLLRHGLTALRRHLKVQGLLG